MWDLKQFIEYDQTEFWTDLEDKTERLSSFKNLCKFEQIKIDWLIDTQTEVWSKNYFIKCEVW